MRKQSKMLNLNLSWQTASYFDYWSVIHFLSGVTIGAAVIVFDWNEVWSWVFLAALLVLWEMFERLIKAGEPLRGVIADIVYGFLGYVSVKFFLVPGHTLALGVGLSALVLVLAGNVVGWRFYIRNKKRISG